MKSFLHTLWLRVSRVDQPDIDMKWGEFLLPIALVIGNAVVHGWFIPGLLSEMDNDPRALYPLIYCGLQTTLSSVVSAAGLWAALMKFLHHKPWQRPPHNDGRIDLSELCC